MKKKLMISAGCLLFIIVFNFALPRLMPGDTVLMLVGIEEQMVSGNEYAYYMEKTGADRPILEQFFEYGKGLFKGDLGYSYHYNETISSLIAARLPNTLQIALPSIVLSACLAAVLGCLMGMKKGSRTESIVTWLMVFCDAVPSFLTGLLLIAFFSFRLGLLPSGALNSIRLPDSPAAFLGDRVLHLVLPVTTMVIAAVPSKYLMVCNSVAKQKTEKYVLYARSWGMSDAGIAFRHIFPNICQPFLTMVGMNIGFVVSGSLVIETIFSIKGMGSLMAQAISNRDYPVLQGCLFVSALVIILASLLTDLLCFLADPKLRYKVHEAE